MTTAFYTDRRSAAHTLAGHPEHAGRLDAVLDRLSENGMMDVLQPVTARSATDEQLLAVHHQRYLDVLEQTRSVSGGARLGLDTYLTSQSYDLARLAAGGAIAIVDAILKGEANNGLAVIRPPGHHATPAQGMGFCLLNNIAIAAQHARQAYGLKRIAIVDFDVHHGNGTQDAFYDDPAVLFISSHQSPLYPGTGQLDEIGSEAGRGSNLNIPLPPQVGDQGFKTIYEQVIFQVIKRFEPELLLVSAGFDAHWADPLANLHLSLTGFDWLTRQLMQLADTICEGKIAFMMEGGYDLKVLSYGWLNIARALLGQNRVEDPFGSAPHQRDLPAQLLDRLQKLHHLTG